MSRVREGAGRELSFSRSVASLKQAVLERSVGRSDIGGKEPIRVEVQVRKGLKIKVGIRLQRM